MKCQYSLIFLCCQKFFFSLYAFDCEVITAVQNIYYIDYLLLMHHLVVIYSCIPMLQDYQT